MTEHVAIVGMRIIDAPVLVAIEPVKEPAQTGPIVYATWRDPVTGDEWKEGSADALVIAGWYRQANG